MPAEAPATEATETDTGQGLGAGPGEFTLGDILGDLAEDARAAEAEAEATEEEPEEPAKPAKGAKPDPKAPKGKAPATAPAKAKVVEVPKLEPGQLKEDFSDDRPWTPERIKAAAAEAKELARRAQNQWVRESKRSEKLERGRAEYLRERGQFQAIRDQFAVDFQALRTGDPKTRLAALGRLGGVDGSQLWEELTLEMVKGGKKHEPTPTEKALQEKLDRLEAKLQRDEEGEELRRQENFLAERKAQLGELGSDAELYPELSTFEPDEIGDALAEVITRVYNQSGKRISDAKAAQMLEQDLVQRRAKRGAPQGASGLGTRAAAGKTSAGAESATQRGRSLAPGLSTRTASRRELTDEELQEDAADLIPASMLRAANPHGL